MLDTRLTEEQEQLRKTVEEFAREVVAPVAAHHDETKTFPYDVVRQMGEMGLFGLPFPEEHGGMGGDYFALCLAIEELAEVDQSVAITLEAGVPSARCRSTGSAPRRRRSSGCRSCAPARRWAPSGSPSPARAATPAAPARRPCCEDGEWVINGTKAFITNSGTDITRLVTVTAVTGDDAERQEGDLARSWCRCRRPASPPSRRTARSAGTPPTPTR